MPNQQRLSTLLTRREKKKRESIVGWPNWHCVSQNSFLPTHFKRNRESLSLLRWLFAALSLALRKTTTTQAKDETQKMKETYSPPPLLERQNQNVSKLALVLVIHCLVKTNVGRRRRERIQKKAKQNLCVVRGTLGVGVVNWLFTNTSAPWLRMTVTLE